MIIRSTWFFSALLQYRFRRSASITSTVLKCVAGQLFGGQREALVWRFFGL
jgi:hypothetical protein